MIRFAIALMITIPLAANAATSSCSAMFESHTGVVRELAHLKIEIDKRSAAGDGAMARVLYSEYQLSYRAALNSGADLSRLSQLIEVERHQAAVVTQKKQVATDRARETEKALAQPYLPLGQLSEGNSWSHLAVSHDGARLLFTTDQREIVVYNIGTKINERTFKVSSPILRNQFWASADLTKLAVQTQSDLHIELFDVASGKSLHAFEGSAAALSADGNAIAIGDGQKITIYSAVTGEALALPILIPWNKIAEIKFSPDGKKIVVRDGDHAIGLWDVISGRHELDFESRYPGSFSFAPDSQRVAVADLQNSNFEIFALGQSKPILSLHVDGESLHEVAFSPDGVSLIGTVEDGQAHRWNADTGDLLNEFPSKVEMKGIRFSGDGATLVLSGNKNADAIFQIYRKGSR